MASCTCCGDTEDEFLLFDYFELREPYVADATSYGYLTLAWISIGFYWDVLDVYPLLTLLKLDCRFLPSEPSFYLDLYCMEDIWYSGVLFNCAFGLLDSCED